jgi:hypothetical protein
MTEKNPSPLFWHGIPSDVTILPSMDDIHQAFVVFYG